MAALLSSSPPRPRTRFEGRVQEHDGHTLLSQPAYRHQHSSHVLPSSSPFGPASRYAPRTTSLHLAVQVDPATDLAQHPGQLSPSFDLAFQESMNISSHSLMVAADGDGAADHPIGATIPPQSESEALQPPSSDRVPKSSPHLMDISPVQAPRPSGSQKPGLPPAARSSPPAFDGAFFNKLKAHQPHQSPSASSISSNSGASQDEWNRRPMHERPLSPVDPNTLPAVSAPRLAIDKSAPASALFPLKRPVGLLRTASVASAPARSSDEPTPEGARRPSIAILQSRERSHSENQLIFKQAGSSDAIEASNDGNNVRRPSRLGRETVFGVGERPSIVPCALQNSRPDQPRKISGSSRVRSKLPHQWQRSSSDQSIPEGHPGLKHANSAPMVRPATWSHLDPGPSYSSDTKVPTRRTLGAEQGSSLAREVFRSPADRSPGHMEVDGLSSPARPSLFPKRSSSSSTSSSSSIASNSSGAPFRRAAANACSPGLGDLFEENAIDASSPVSAAQAAFPASGIVGRKRGMEDPDSSLTSIFGDGNNDEVEELQSDFETDTGLPSRPGTSNGNLSRAILSKGSLPSVQLHGTRTVHRATSSASLNSNSGSRKRGSGICANAGASVSTSCLTSTLAPSYSGSKGDGVRESSGRHRKMSRGVDGRPALVHHRTSSSSGAIAGGNARRVQSMCDSEFYASPPLGKDDAAVSQAGPSPANASDGYFAGAASVPDIQMTNAKMAHHVSQPVISGSKIYTTTRAKPEDAIPDSMFSPPRALKNNPALQTYQPSPEQNLSFTSGFGCKEAQGKILPCHSVKEDGLMRITAATLNNLLAGDYDEQIDKFIVIDCRFDYEYSGGHIEGAINLPTSSQVEDFFLSHGPDHPLYGSADELPAPTKSGCPDPAGNAKKTILVFHCEFSCKRAPTLAKHLRSRDRARNHACYPAVHYPELYVLQGGYAECWNTYPERCDPKGYIQMDDVRFLQKRQDDLQELRRKRMGVRAKSYTFGENMFSHSAGGGAPAPQMRQGLLMQNTRHRSSANISSSSAANQSSSTSSFSKKSAATSKSSTAKAGHFSASLFSGVIHSAELSVHEEDEEPENTSGSSAAAFKDGGAEDDSFSGTKHGLGAAISMKRNPLSSSLMSCTDGEGSSSPCGPVKAGRSHAAALLGDDGVGRDTAGGSPCPGLKPSKSAFTNRANTSASGSGGLFGALKAPLVGRGGRQLQRANTSQALPLGL